MTENHVGWFVDWIDREEVDHEDINVRLFSQRIAREARRWFSSLPDSSILGYQALEDAFK